jgi:primosomal protein N' (replication factor Y)
MLLCDVALPLPFASARKLTYEVPAALDAVCVPGARVIVPLGSRRELGVLLARHEGEPPPKVRAVIAVPDAVPSLPPDLLEFLRELSNYYLAPIGEVLRLALPPVDRGTQEAIVAPSLFGTTKGVAEALVAWVEVDDGPAPPKLTPKQAAMLARIRAVGSVPLARLEETWPSARATVKKLEASHTVKIVQRPRAADPFFATAVERDAPPALTDAQRSATERIGAALGAQSAHLFLLHGVTGSGKTEVYLSAIAAARAQKRGTIVLLPEIALTPQLVGRFRARFGDDVAVLHSALTPKERHGMWHRLRRGEVDVAIGARSALFAPIANLGLVVVDEEHDASFKQDEGVRYHARDMAILRAHRARGVCVLGSATPSLETEYLARTGKAERLRLPARARAQALPKVEVVDLRRIGAGPTGDKRISLPLHRALEETLAAKEQAILFLNRRGFAPSVRCEACGVVAECPHCSVALTYHKRHGGILRCHYCDYEEPLLEHCKKCRAPALAFEGLGTEKLEETLAKAFPEARVARLDRDVASGKNIEAIIERVRRREVDVLVGTQMVTKGHDLPHVTLVGVVNADAALSIPDFRASERAFQLMVQVAGRAGRGDLPGRVLVQSYDPEHVAIAYAVRHDVDGFLERELADRRELGYPPFSRAALLRFDALDEAEARGACGAAAEACRRVADPSVMVLGPSPAPLARLRNRWRFRVLVRCPERAPLRKVLLAAERFRRELPRAIRMVIDVDPVQLL